MKITRSAFLFATRCRFSLSFHTKEVQAFPITFGGSAARTAPVSAVNCGPSPLKAAASMFPTSQTNDEETNPTEHRIENFPAEEVFEEAYTFAAVKVPARRTAKLRQELQHVLWKRPRMKNVYNLADAPDHRVLVLEERQQKNQEQNIWNDPVLQKLLKEGKCFKSTQIVKICYEHKTASEILTQILPSSEEIPSAFELVGHIAHINLRDNLIPYRYWIGKVLLDKNPAVKTVVNKIGTISSEYRTFGMEVIAGEDSPGWSLQTVREEGCKFTLDFQQVYWNSRLAGEHKRLVRLIQKGANASESNAPPLVVADLMAGVGPFAVPLTSDKGKSSLCTNAKARPIHVHANDLNPASYKYLKINSIKNNCRQLTCYNQDARAFLWHLLEKQHVEPHHIIMNLPATAPEFLDVFAGYTGKRLPRVHVHCFAPKPTKKLTEDQSTIVTNDDYLSAIHRCSSALGCELNNDKVQVHVVRNVAPNKNMLCISFLLPEAVRQLPRMQLTTEDSEQPIAKRQKSETYDDD